MANQTPKSFSAPSAPKPQRGRLVGDAMTSTPKISVKTQTVGKPRVSGGTRSVQRSVAMPAKSYAQRQPTIKSPVAPTPKPSNGRRGATRKFQS